MKRKSKGFSPLHIFSAGSITTFAVIQGVKLLAKRSKTVENILNKGFGAVEGRIDDLKHKVMPEEKTSTVQ